MANKDAPTTRPTADPPATGQPGTFEQSLAELEKIVHELEDGELGLADSLARYEQGVKHLKHCYQLLQSAERKIDLLTGVTDDGAPITQPLPIDGAPLDESTGRRRSRKFTDIDG